MNVIKDKYSEAREFDSFLDFQIAEHNDLSKYKEKLKENFEGKATSI